MSSPAEEKMLVEDLELRFGSVQALSSISFTVYDKEILALIGPNGAGKTSLLNCISGFYNANRGRVLFKGLNISRLSPSKRAQLGISRTFQNIELYTGLTVLDNLMASRHIYIRYGPIAGSFFLGKARREEVKNRAKVEEIIDLLELAAVRHKIVETLPYGVRKRVDLGRALALDPQLLLLDEPMAGMNVEEKEDMARFILDVQELKKIPIIIVEHDMGVVMDISQRVVVLDFGTKIAEGTPEYIKSDENVIRAYLGKQAKPDREKNVPVTV
jgi:branched-chain amino acid transport system ATP-binding protein